VYYHYKDVHLLKLAHHQQQLLINELMQLF
jgi:hypothetical protein